MLSVARFNRLIHGLGQNVEWRKAHACPCINPASGGARTDCLQCHGDGWLWEASVQSFLALSGQKVQREWANLGLWESGDAVVSLPSDELVYGLGEYDRVLMVDSTRPFSRIMTRGQRDRLDIYATVQVDRVFWLDENQNIVEGDMPAIADDGALSWTGSGPPNGQQYTVTGREHPEYFCFREFPQDRAHIAGKTFPRRVVLRLMDLMTR